MINRGLLHKGYLESRLVTVLCGIGFIVVELLLSRLLPVVAKQFPNALQMPFIRSMMKTLLGPAIGDQIGIEMIQSLLWAHPVVLLLLWGHELALGTRLPTAELDRGTMNVVMSWPVSRARVYINDTLVWIVAGLVVLVMGLTGHLIGRTYMEPHLHLAPRTIMIVMINLWALYLSVGGMIYLVAALSNQRSQAAGISFILVLGSFLLNFLAQYWPAAERVDFLSVLTYYRPFAIIKTGTCPLTDLLILWAIAFFCWLAGLFVFNRRDL